MKRGFRLWMCVVCCLSLAGAALAAPGDTLLYPYRDAFDTVLPEGEEAEEQVYVDSAAVQPDGVYALVGQTITRWQPGDEAPTPYLELPEALWYYQAYDADRGEDAPLSQEDMDALASTIHQLIPGDDGLYGLNLYTLGLARVTAEGLDFLPEVEMPPMQKQESEWGSMLREIRGAFVQEGTLVIMLGSEEDSDWNSQFLYLVDLESGTLRAIDPALDPRMVAPFREGQILMGISQNTGGYPRTVNLETLDLQTGTPGGVLQEGIPGDWYQMGGYTYDAGENALYFLNENQVQKMDLATGQTEGYAFLPISSASSSAATGILEGGYYVVQDYQGIYVRNLDPAYRVTRALRINGSWEDDAYRRFVQEHPDIPVLLQQQDRYDSEDIANAIQSGETQTDLFTTSAYGGLSMLTQKGYAGDLSSSEALVAAVEAMYPQVREELLDEDGRLLGFPQHFSLSPMRVNVTLFEEHFPGEELPQTWAEFMGLYLDFADRGEEDVSFLDYYVDRTSVIYMIINQFALVYETPDAPLDFQHPALREALSMAENLVDESIRTEDGRQMTREEMDQMNIYYARRPIFESYAGMFEDTDYLARVNRVQEVSADGGMIVYESYGSTQPDGTEEPPDEYRLFTQPVFEAGQTPVIEGYLTVFLLNPKSDNQDLAILYLEAYAQAMDTQYLYGLTPDLTEPVRPRYFESNRKWDVEYLAQLKEDLETAAEADRRGIEEEIERVEGDLAYGEETEWEISAKALAAYREIAPYMKVSSGGIFSYGSGEGGEEINALMNRYISGQMELDAFLRELDAKARMMYLEGK